MKRRVLAGVSVAAAAGIAVTATMAMNAEAAWTSTWNVSASGWTPDDSPTVSVDRQGDALLAWNACDLSTPGCYYRIQARVKNASGTVTAIRTLSPDGAAPSWPEAASDDTGDSAVVWQQDSQVVGRRVSASGSLVGPLQKLSTSAPATTPVVAVTPGGTAMAAWTEIRDGSWYAVARRLKLDGTLGAPITLGSGSAEKPAIGVDRSGQFVVAWARTSDVVARRITSTSVSSTKVLTSPIASYGGFGMVRVGVDRDGDAVITYHSGGGDRSQVWASRWSRTGTLAAPLRISASTDNVGFHHALATDLDGDSMIVWTRYNSTGKLELLGRHLSAAGARGAVTSLGLGDRPDLALDDDGDGMLVFHTVVPKSTPPYSYTKTSARLISRSGTFGTTKTLTSDGRVPQVDTRPTSRFTVIWQQESFPYTIKSVAGP
ncbi:hypothetical protein [Streptomyces sp. PSKA30]|uniref:hypothetical protein n=1 Tax=Streptomyces sp. PSKA30 TaxID=2874597 RepID=UPI001CD16823|nr:hypothetical protein [Streptomyces sp. PSKA30]MBZ9645238.1 hypothetical protein [Streptomyces sp. PSKA30]